MPTPRRLLQDLSARLAMFFIALAFPAMLLVQTTIVTFEFRRLLRDVDEGALSEAVTRATPALAPRLAVPMDVPSIRDWLDVWVLKLAHPQSGLSAEGSYVLLELSDQPFAAAVYDVNGAPVARTAHFADADPAALIAALSGRVFVDGSDQGSRVQRRVTAPVYGTEGQVRGALHLELDLPRPWSKLLGELAVEWPIMLGYLVIFGAATALFFSRYVSRRLAMIAGAADRWSRGDFTRTIDDRTDDELGSLSRRLDRMAKELSEHLATRAQLATLEARQRFARDLHDTVKQKAFALNLQIGAAKGVLERDPDQARVRLDDAGRLVEDIQRELATLIVELREEAADGQLPERLQELAQAWAARSGIEVRWTACDPSTQPRWVQSQVLRLFEEALSNIWRHSGATVAEIGLRAAGGRCTLEVHDRGRGMPGEGRTGMGTRNMRERAQALPDGSLTIESRPDFGTRVVVSWAC
jgi:signal transduction histidine kinase